MTLYEMLRQHWIHTGIAVNPGATDSEIRTFARTHGLALPESFRTYLRTVNGMRDGDTDEEMLSFLSLSSISKEKSENTHVCKASVPFAEWSLYSHWYELRPTEPTDAEPIVVVADGTYEKTIDGCFDSFVRRYLADARSVVMCWE